MTTTSRDPLTSNSRAVGVAVELADLLLVVVPLRSVQRLEEGDRRVPRRLEGLAALPARRAHPSSSPPFVPWGVIRASTFNGMDCWTWNEWYFEHKDRTSAKHLAITTR